LTREAEYIGTINALRSENASLKTSFRRAQRIRLAPLDGDGDGSVGMDKISSDYEVRMRPKSIAYTLDINDIRNLRGSMAIEASCMKVHEQTQQFMNELEEGAHRSKPHEI